MGGTRKKPPECGDFYPPVTDIDRINCPFAPSDDEIMALRLPRDGLVDGGVKQAIVPRSP